MDHGYLESIRKQFRYYKQLGDERIKLIILSNKNYFLLDKYILNLC